MTISTGTSDLLQAGSSTSVTPVKSRVGTTAARVLARVRTLILPVQELSENDQDLRVLAAAEERYADLNWRKAFKPIK